MATLAERDSSSGKLNVTEPLNWATNLGLSWAGHLAGLEATLAPVNHPIFKSLNPREGASIAEIGCGGGGFARYIANKMKGRVNVTGFDISADLLELAKAQANNLPIHFVEADAQRYNPPNTKFDFLTSRFGVMFFEDEEAAFRNLLNWLKPGGRFSFAVWASFDENPWHGVVRKVVSEALDLPDVLTGRPSSVRYSDIDYFISLLKTSGFFNVSSCEWGGLLKLGGGLPASAAAAFGLSAFWSDALPKKGPLYKSVLRELTNILGDFEKDGIVTMPAKAFIVSGGR